MLAGQHVVGYLVAKHEYTVNLALFVVARLLNVSEVPLLYHAIAGPRHGHWHGGGMVGTAGVIHLLQAVPNGLVSELGHGNEYRLPDLDAVRKQLLIARVNKLILEVRPRKHADSGRRTGNQFGQTAALTLGLGLGGQRLLRALLHPGLQLLVELLELLAGQHLVRHLDGHGYHTDNLFFSGAPRLVRHVVVPLVGLA